MVFQCFKKALVDQFHAPRVFLIGGFHFESALKIVEDGQQRLHRVHRSKFKELTTLTLHAAAVIFELRLPAHQQIEQFGLLMRRQAEFENYRRRAERERSELFEFASMDTIKALLPILDDFERALKAETADKKYARGMELIYQSLFDALKKLGLEPLSTEGTLFNPHIHHAVEMVDTTEHPDQTILEEYQRGYKFKGRLLRPAMLKVAVNP
jgi:molecular chaperone GrpE